MLADDVDSKYCDRNIMSSNDDAAPQGFKAPDRYFTPAEVELHNSESDLWLSWLGHVYDLTSLSEQFKGKIIQFLNC